MSFAWPENKAVNKFQWAKEQTHRFGSASRRIAVHSEADEGQQTVMDAHRRWATVKNERMGIVFEVTHTDDGGREARDEQKRGLERGVSDEPEGSAQRT